MNKGSNLPQLCSDRLLPENNQIVLIIRHFCHTHYLTPDNTSLVFSDQTLYQAAPLETSLLQRFTAESSRELRIQCLETQQEEASVDVTYPLQIVNLVPFSLYLYPLSLSPFLNPLSSPSHTIPSFSSDQFFVLLR